MGFFTDPATDKKSMTRLVVFMLTMAAEAVVAAILYIAVQMPPSTSVDLIKALTVALGALVASGVVALLLRSKDADTGGD